MRFTRLMPFDRALPGQFLPTFSMRSTANQRIRSIDLFGTRLVLMFTDGVGDALSCAMLIQLKAIHPRLVMAGGTVLAIAPVDADTGFLVEPGVAVPFPVLRDVAADVHRQYGAVDWSGQPAASLFIANHSQRIVYRALSGLGEKLPTGRDVLSLIDFDRLSTSH